MNRMVAAGFTVFVLSTPCATAAVQVAGEIAQADVNSRGDVTVVAGTSDAATLYRYDDAGQLLWWEPLPGVPGFLRADSPNGLAIAGEIPEAGGGWARVFLGGGQHWDLPAGLVGVQVSRNGERIMGRFGGETRVYGADGSVLRSFALTATIEEVVTLSFDGEAVVVVPGADDDGTGIVIYNVQTGGYELLQPHAASSLRDPLYDMAIAVDSDHVAVLIGGRAGFLRPRSDSGSWMFDAGNGSYETLYGASVYPVRLVAGLKGGFDVRTVDGKLHWQFRRDMRLPGVDAETMASGQPSMLDDGSIVLRDFRSGRVYLLAWATDAPSGTAPVVSYLGTGADVDPSGSYSLTAGETSFSLIGIQ